ncbi:unnamed protein product [Sphagnum balticum]
MHLSELVIQSSERQANGPRLYFALGNASVNEKCVTFGVATTDELSHIGVPPGPPTVRLQLVTPRSSSHSDDVSVDLPSELQANIKQQSWIYKSDLHHHTMNFELFKSQRVIIEEFLDL